MAYSCGRGGHLGVLPIRAIPASLYLVRAEERLASFQKGATKTIMPITDAIFFMKGAPNPPAPIAPPSPTTASDNASNKYREEQPRKAQGFSASILGGAPDASSRSILGG